MLALNLLQVSRVYINTLMIQRVLSESAWADRMTAEDKRGRTSLVWEHVNPYGLFLLDMKTDWRLKRRRWWETDGSLRLVTRVLGRFEEQRASIEAKFLNAFPDFHSSRARIYLMLSMFRFDGKIPHDNPGMLLLGLDGLAKFHGADARLPVILSHELFHVYHFQVNPLPRDVDQIELYRLIWQEGLATYVSQVL
ncbi:MAG: hypothetical protein QOJ42_6865, partial [Acidobacteriaceae bacterium]|nr:hypothetical protein [Acidobacteriaceae bacterium]